MRFLAEVERGGKTATGVHALDDHAIGGSTTKTPCTGPPEPLVVMR